MFMLRTLASSILLLGTAHVLAQTLYQPGISVPPYTATVISNATVLVFEDNYTIVPQGVGADGETTYVEEAIQTVVAVVGRTSTYALHTTASAFTKTFVEDASGWRFSDGTPDAAATCVFTSGRASCKGAETTYVKALIPIYTLGEPALTPAPTQTASESNSGDSRLAPRTAVFGVFTLLHVLHLVFGL